MGNGYDISVCWVNSFGGTYTTYANTLWKHKHEYIFAYPNSGLISQERRILSRDILYIDMGKERILFSKGNPCPPK